MIIYDLCIIHSAMFLGSSVSTYLYIFLFSIYTFYPQTPPSNNQGATEGVSAVSKSRFSILTKETPDKLSMPASMKAVSNST